MSETILKAMMQLFAIVAKPENSEAERHVVENFYFGRVDVLNLFSGSKQYTEEGVKQFKISKSKYQQV